MIQITKIPFIGKHVKLMKTTKTLQGIEGEIIDETKHQFTLETLQGIKKVDKRAAHFQIIYQNQEYIINGNLIAKTPEERIKAKAVA